MPSTARTRPRRATDNAAPSHHSPDHDSDGGGPHSGPMPPCPAAPLASSPAESGPDENVSAGDGGEPRAPGNGDSAAVQGPHSGHAAHHPRRSSGPGQSSAQPGPEEASPPRRRPRSFAFSDPGPPAPSIRGPSIPGSGPAPGFWSRPSAQPAPRLKILRAHRSAGASPLFLLPPPTPMLRQLVSGLLI